MIAKRSSRALAVLLALPSAAFALGLGDIRLLSALNAPLEAEIDLVDVTPEEMSTVQAQLASRDTFARYGLDWPPYLSGVQVRTVRMRIGARDRLERFIDPDSGVEIGASIGPEDPLKFRDSKRYRDRLAQAQKATNEKDAMVVLAGTLHGRSPGRQDSARATAARHRCGHPDSRYRPHRCGAVGASPRREIS